MSYCRRCGGTHSNGPISLPSKCGRRLRKEIPLVQQKVGFCKNKEKLTHFKNVVFIGAYHS